MDVEHLLQTMRTRPDRRTFRVAALGLALIVLCTDKVLGGSWWAFLVAGALIAAMNILVPVERPARPARQKILTCLLAIRGSPLIYRTSVALFLIITVTVLTSRFSEIMGRQFNLSLLPILLCSFFFGLRVSILAWLASFLAVYFLVIPPVGSFAIDSASNFVGLIVYFYLGLAALGIPVLIWTTSCAAEANIGV